LHQAGQACPQERGTQSEICLLQARETYVGSTAAQQAAREGMRSGRLPSHTCLVTDHGAMQANGVPSRIGVELVRLRRASEVASRSLTRHTCRLGKTGAAEARADNVLTEPADKSKERM
jgi:hypothetical protein